MSFAQSYLLIIKGFSLYNTSCFIPRVKNVQQLQICHTHLCVYVFSLLCSVIHVNFYFLFTSCRTSSIPAILSYLQGCEQDKHQDSAYKCSIVSVPTPGLIKVPGTFRDSIAGCGHHLHVVIHGTCADYCGIFINNTTFEIRTQA